MKLIPDRLNATVYCTLWGVLKADRRARAEVCGRLLLGVLELRGSVPIHIEDVVLQMMGNKLQRRRGLALFKEQQGLMPPFKTIPEGLSGIHIPIRDKYFGPSCHYDNGVITLVGLGARAYSYKERNLSSAAQVAWKMALLMGLSKQTTVSVAKPKVKK
jgi:hypothetical protein